MRIVWYLLAQTRVFCVVQFPYFEICGVKKRGKIKEEGGAGYKASICFTARDVSEKYQSEVYRPLEHLELAQSL
jgi:hypothetical protein